MRSVFRFCAILFSFVIATALAAGIDVALAQSAIDPSSALLLNPGSSSSEPESARPLRSGEPRLESGRYTTRTREKTIIVQKKTSETSVGTSGGTSATAAATSSNSPSAAPNAPTSQVPAPASTPVVLVPNEQGIVVIPENPPSLAPASPASQAPALNASSSAATSNGTAPEAPPSRLLEVSIASTYLYENSESGYSFRQYNMSGPAYVAGGKVWLSPEFALGGRYVSSLGGQVPDRSSTVGATHTEATFGAYYRKNFASSNLTIGLESTETQFRVASESLTKVKTKSSGVRLSIEGAFSNWSVGASVSPKLTHEESSAATDVRSGTGVDASAVDASLERRWRFDSTNSMFVRLEHRIERDLFSGSATTVDPVNGATPNGVGVTVGTTLIQFGYNWGN